MDTLQYDMRRKRRDAVKAVMELKPEARELAAQYNEVADVVNLLADESPTSREEKAKRALTAEVLRLSNL